jgi:glycerol uptake facilitator-like aquaporin
MNRIFIGTCLFVFVKGILIEAIVTFVLVTVILMVALDTKSKTGLAPLLIGFALAVNILAM